MRCSTGSAPPTSACIPTTVTGTTPAARDTLPSSTPSSRATFRTRGESMTNAAVHEYWQQALAELARCPARPEIEPLPLRSTAFATLYGVRLSSAGPYRLFGYLSIPKGTGPFPAIYYAPKYQSVLEIIPQGTANLQRSRYVTFSLAGRGQRNADSPYAAMFPGLLTDGIDSAPSYPFRGVVADAVRGLEFLLTRRAVDAAHVIVAGNAIALLTA